MKDCDSINYGFNSHYSPDKQTEEKGGVNWGRNEDEGALCAPLSACVGALRTAPTPRSARLLRFAAPFGSL